MSNKKHSETFFRAVVICRNHGILNFGQTGTVFENYDKNIRVFIPDGSNDNILVEKKQYWPAVMFHEYEKINRALEKAN